MGDRVLIQVVGDSEEFSPVAYGHWSGADTPEVIARLRDRMADRAGDVSYAFARLIQEMTTGSPGNLGFGCWNTDHVLTAEDSHGDAGVVVVDCARGFRCACHGGYLKTGPDGLPVIKD